MTTIQIVYLAVVATVAIIALIFFVVVTRERWQWYRRHKGGHWEKWYFEPTRADVWYQLEHCSRETGYRPGGCHGAPVCEDYPVK